MSTATVTKSIRLSPEESEELARLSEQTALRGGAAMASVSYNRFLCEVQARNIVILEDDRFLERLAFLADTFEDEDLRSTIKHVLSYSPSASASAEASEQALDPVGGAAEV